MSKNKGNQNTGMQPQVQAQAKVQAPQNTGKQQSQGKAPQKQSDQPPQPQAQKNQAQQNQANRRKREEDDWSDFRRKPDTSFKKLPKTNCYRDWWVAVLSAIAMFIWAFWFATKNEPEVREFIRLFSIITGGLLIWIFGQAFAAHLLRSFLLKLGFSKKVLDRKVSFGYYGRRCY